MTNARSLHAILTADIGTTLTHVSLIERVSGVYRLVASAERPTTISGDEEDVTIGLERAVRRIEEVVGRRLWGEEGPLLPGSARPDHASGADAPASGADAPVAGADAPVAGIDALVATCSVAPAMATAVIGMTDRLSVESARRACEASNVRLERCVALGSQFRNWDEGTLEELHRYPPEVIVLVGGSDSGPVAPLESAAHVLTTLYERMEPHRRPVIVFAGNPEARRPLRDAMGPVFEFRVVDNVRPNVHVESLGELKRELGQLYETVALPRVPGYARLAEWLATPLRSTAEGLGGTLRFLARRAQGTQGVLALDAGGLTTHLAAARDGNYQWSTCADMGTSYGLDGVLAYAGVEALQAWLPRPLDADEVAARLHNARLRPHSVAQSEDDLLLLHAALRASLSCAMGRLQQQWVEGEEPPDPEVDVPPPFDLLAARGGVVTRTGADSLVALSLLDALRPIGLSRIVLDWAAVWPQLSVLATVAPVAALQVLDRDAFRPLGTVIAPLGTPRGDQVALRITMTRDTGVVSESEVPAGTVARIPLRTGETATIVVQPSRHFDLGLGRPGVGGRATVQGGGLGLIIDTRGRPLRHPADLDERRGRMIRWLRNLEGDGHASP